MENFELENYGHEPKFSTNIETEKMREARMNLSMTSRRERGEIMRSIEDEIAKKLDPIGGIHGVQMVLKSLGYYMGSIDGKIRSDKTTGVIGALIAFQKSLPTVQADEYGRFSDMTLTALQNVAKEKGLRLPPKSSDRSLRDTGTLVGNKEQFLSHYGGLIDSLTGSLGLRSYLMLAISKIESDYGVNAKDTPGGTGVMQLTRVVFDDMAGMTGDKKFDARKVGVYQKIFQKIDLSALKGQKFGEKTLEKSLPESVWNDLMVLCDKNTDVQTFSQTIRKIQNYERGNMKNYSLHTLNMIISGAYLAFISKPKMTLEQIGIRYNGHPDNKYTYGKKVRNIALAYKNSTQFA